MLRVLVHSLCVAFLACCGFGNTPGFEAGSTRPLVQRPGDQVHPAVEGDRIAWFDLEDDPNGACFVPPSGQDYDRTCDGVIKTLDRETGEVITLSEVLGQETRPVVSQDLVAWRCHRHSGGSSGWASAWRTVSVAVFRAGACTEPAARTEPVIKAVQRLSAISHQSVVVR